MGPSRRKLLIATDDLDVGGSQWVAVNVANNIPVADYEIHMAAAIGKLHKHLASSVTFHEAPRRRGVVSTLRFCVFMATVIIAGRFDIVHSHQRLVSLVARACALFTNTIVIEHVHNTFPKTPLSFASFRGHRLIACSEGISTMLTEKFHRRAGNIDVVNNSAGPQDSEITLHSLRSHDMSILAVGRQSPQKNPDRFRRVVNLAAVSKGHISGTWIGGATSPTEAITGHHGVVQFIGEREQQEIQAWIRDSHLVLLTSRWEGQPLVALEALANGRAVMLPNVGGCPDLIRPGAQQFLYEPHLSDAELADKIASFSCEELLNEGVLNRQYYLEKFSFARQIAAITSCYTKALERSKS